MTLTPPTDAVWHEHYDDPNGDLILVSNDNVKFRTSARLLAKTCNDFGNLSDDHPLRHNGPSPNTLLLDHPAGITTRFLDIVSVATPVLLTSYTFDVMVELLVMADYFHAHKLLPMIKARLHQVTSYRGVDLLVLASKRDDWEMGRRALRSLYANAVKNISTRPGGFKGLFDTLRPAWRQKLMEIVFFAALEDRKLVHEWQGLHDQFVPPKPPEITETIATAEVTEPVESAEGPESVAEVPLDKRGADEEASESSKRVKVES